MIQRYLNRITSEHKVRPKFMAWLAENLNLAGDTIELYRSFDKSFDLNAASGKQLDMLGEIVGISRLLSFEPVYASPLLSDEYYRMILRAKISLNHWDGTVQGIQELWTDIFNGYTLEIVDRQDMSMLLRIRGPVSLFESEFISRGYLAPKPESVRVNYEFVMERHLEETLFIGGTLGVTSTAFTLASPTNVTGTHTSVVYAGGISTIYTRHTLPGTKERGT